MKWLRFTDQKCELKPDCLVLPTIYDYESVTLSDYALAY